MLKEPFASQFETGISKENLTQLTHVSRLLDEILNRAPTVMRLCRFVGLYP
jgi:2-isopropylmalate synthase